MDELELLKKDWNKEKPDEFPKYTEEQLFQMTKKRSVDVSKSLLIIGIIETCIWSFLLYKGRNFHEEYFITPMYRVPLFVFFLWFLIYNFRKIRNESNSKSLMKQILVLRKIIISYIILMIFSILLFTYLDFETHTLEALRGFVDGWNGYDCKSELQIGSNDISLNTALVFFGIFFTIGIGIILFIYKITYGKLLKKLQQNYNELNSQTK